MPSLCVRQHHLTLSDALSGCPQPAAAALPGASRNSRRALPHAPQITAIIFLPNFPGWLAPLAFNPVRFLEFFSFAATLLGTWVATGARHRLPACKQSTPGNFAHTTASRPGWRAGPLVLRRQPVVAGLQGAEFPQGGTWPAAERCPLQSCCAAGSPGQPVPSSPPPPLQACSLGGTALPPRQTCRRLSGKRGHGCGAPAAGCVGSRSACACPPSPRLLPPLAASPMHARPANNLLAHPSAPRPRCPAAAPAACGSSACPWRRPSWCC